MLIGKTVATHINIKAIYRIYIIKQVVFSKENISPNYSFVVLEKYSPYKYSHSANFFIRPKFAWTRF